MDNFAIQARLQEISRRGAGIVTSNGYIDPDSLAEMLANNEFADATTVDLNADLMAQCYTNHGLPLDANVAQIEWYFDASEDDLERPDCHHTAWVWERD